MADTSSLWICTECGKVCKSRGGLKKHGSVHKRRLCVGETHNDTFRIYHPLLDGMSVPLCPIWPLLNLPKGSLVLWTDSFFHPKCHQSPHLPNPMTTGPRSPHVQDSSLRRYYILQHHSPTRVSTNYSVSGVPPSFLTATLHRLKTTTTSTQQSTPSSLAMYPGSRTLLGTMGSVLTMRLYLSG
jgi:hypothetical protein